MYRYEQYLDDATKYAIRKGLSNGMATGISTFLFFCVYTLGIVSNCDQFSMLILFLSLIGFWYGTKLIWNEHYSIGDIFIVSTKK
jgi:hypothetical protein